MGDGGRISVLQKLTKVRLPLSLLVAGWDICTKSRMQKKMAVAQVNGSEDNGALAYENNDGRFMAEQRRAHVKAFRFNEGHDVAPEVTLLGAARWIHSGKEF